MPTRRCVGMCRADRQHAHANSGVGMPPGAENAQPTDALPVRARGGNRGASPNAVYCTSGGCTASPRFCAAWASASYVP